MALQVMNAPGQPGYVLLVFDRDIDSDPLQLAIYNRISRTYLGHSIGKANWSPARSHFFEAELVSRSDGETVFRIGPEVTAFIPDETTLELTSEDDAIRETTVWRSVLLDFHWRAPDVDKVDERVKRPAKESARRDRNEAERSREPAADRPRQAEASHTNAETVRTKEEKPPPEAIAGPASDHAAETAELASWDVIKASENSQDLRDHLERFPKGITELMARTRLEALVGSGLDPTVSSPFLLGFLEAFPDGAHAGEVWSKLEVLERQAAAAQEANARERLAAEAREAEDAAAGEQVAKHLPESTHADVARTQTEASPRPPRKAIFVAAATSAFVAVVAVAVTALLIAAAGGAFLRF